MEHHPPNVAGDQSAPFWSAIAYATAALALSLAIGFLLGQLFLFERAGSAVLLPTIVTIAGIAGATPVAPLAVVVLVGLIHCAPAVNNAVIPLYAEPLAPGSLLLSAITLFYAACFYRYLSLYARFQPANIATPTVGAKRRWLRIAQSPFWAQALQRVRNRTPSRPEAPAVDRPSAHKPPVSEVVEELATLAALVAVALVLAIVVWIGMVATTPMAVHLRLRPSTYQFFAMVWLLAIVVTFFRLTLWGRHRGPRPALLSRLYLNDLLWKEMRREWMRIAKYRLKQSGKNHLRRPRRGQD